MAAPGSVIGPTRLVFKMARQWHAKMRQEAKRIIRGLADATMMRTTAIAARTATKARIRFSMRMAIVPATSLHAAATKLFKSPAGTSCRASRRPVPGWATLARHVFCNFLSNASEVCGHERRGVMTEQNRSSFAVVTFYTTSALATALGLAILITSATIAYMVAQSASTNLFSNLYPSQASSIETETGILGCVGV